MKLFSKIQHFIFYPLLNTIKVFFLEKAPNVALNMNFNKTFNRKIFSGP